VTFIEGMDLAAVAAAFGGVLEEAVEIAFDSAYEPDYEHDVVVLRQVGDWVVAIEDNGWQGSRPEVLRSDLRCRVHPGAVGRADSGGAAVAVAGGRG
jgi:hypothetical protein